MNAQALLKHYERIADAPDAVGRLRRFVLALAVRGKLVPQSASKEPAPFTSRDRAVVATPFAIPSSWSWMTLGTLGNLKGGGTPSKSCANFWDGDIPWASPKDMKVDYLHTAQLHISEEAIRSSAAGLISSGSIVFVVRGMILAHSFPVAIACVQLAINQDMKALELKYPEMAEFVLRALKGLKPEMLARVQRSTHGTCRLEGNDYGNFPVPIPPLEEQHRIVAKVDELMDLCDQLEAARAELEATRDRLAAASLSRLNTPDPDPETFKAHARFAISTALAALTTRPDQIKQLRPTILNLAIQGRLVPQDPSDEPIDALLSRIAQFRASQVGKSRGRGAIPVLRDGGTPYDAPAGWVWTRFGDIVVSRDGERIPVSKEERNTKEKLFDYYGASGVIDKIDGFLFSKPLLLIGEDGANLINRSTPIAFIARGKYWVNNHAHVIDGLSEEFLQYIELFINAIDLKPYVTGTAQPKMNQAKMNTIKVALPPFAEQVRIVAKVNELMQLCDQLEASLVSGADTRRRLLDALLHEALAPANGIEEAA